MKHQCLSPVAIALGLLAGLSAIPAIAQQNGSAMTTATLAGSPAFSIRDHMPAGYREVARRAVAVDGERAELIRFERLDGRNAGLGGEHFSMVLDGRGRLKGFARLDADIVGGALPSREEAQAIAMDFLKRQAPDLLAAFRLHWVAAHDEPLRVTRNGRAEMLTLTGMKVKMRNTVDGRWFWVIVGADRKVMVFERDIVWITFPGRRGTEKWLHDAWLVETGHGLRSS